MRVSHQTVLMWVILLIVLGFAAALPGQVAAPVTPAPAAPVAPAPAKIAKPTTVIEPANCVTAECHADVKAFKFVHGPVNVNGCDACHALVDAKTHDYDLARPKADTCTFCHKVETGGMPVVHKPVTEGNCDGCHNPHGGNTRALLHGKSVSDTCVRCHNDPMAGKKNVHGPAAAGACDACHTPHAAKFPKLVNAQGRDLCFTCHAEMKEQMGRVKFQHKAVEADCQGCHDPHASDFVKMTKQDPVQLCTSCHEHQNVKTAALDATHKHSVVTSDQACLNCHTAHGGNLDNLMKAEPAKVCMKCHAEPIKSPDGKEVLVASVAEAIDPKLVKHGPIRDGNCGGCHDPHGSPNSRLLAKPYPDTFYQAFSLEQYELCFTCHDKQLVLAEEAKGLTGFRNGEQNLHFVHVNKSDRGRNCRACHETHASPQPLHVREKVPFGNWQLPINFAKTDAGGSCSPGCHKPYGYDRDKPIDYKAVPGPTTAPAAPAGGSVTAGASTAAGSEGRS